MADRDYSAFIDSLSTAPTKDYGSQFADAPEGDVPLITLDRNLVTMVPSVEQKLLDTRQFLQQRGYDEGTVDAIVRPFGDPNNFDLGRFADMLQTTQRDRIATEEVLKLTQSLRDDNQLILDPDEVRGMQELLSKFGAEDGTTIQLLAEGHRFLNRLWRAGAIEVARQRQLFDTNLTLGLALLDPVVRLDNWGLSKAIFPDKQREEIENELFPTVTMGGREFSTSTAASMHQIFQRAVSNVEMASSLPLRSFEKVSGLIGSQKAEEVWREAADRVQDRSQERREKAEKQLPSLVAGLARPLLWQEVVERNWDPVLDIDSFYRTQFDSGNWKNMLALSTFFAVGDLVFTPTQLVAVGSSKVVPTLQKAGQAGLRKVAPEVAAQTTARIARRTFNPEDALKAVEEATEAHKRAVRAMNEAEKRSIELTGTPAGVPDEVVGNVIRTRVALNNEKLFLKQMQNVGYDIPRTAKRHPKALPDPEIMAKALELETRDPQLAKEILKELGEERAALLNRDHDPASMISWDEAADLPGVQQRSILGPDDAEQAGDGLYNYMRTGGLGIDDVGSTPLAPEYAVLPDEVPLLPWRAMDEAGDILPTEREIAALVKGKDYDLNTSTQRMLARGEDRVRRQLGAARRMGDKGAIKDYEERLVSLRKARERVRRGMPQEALAYDDVELPKGVGLLEDQGKLQRWLDKATTRATESLYPGGLSLAVSDMTQKIFGRFNWFREPQRFFGTYAPDAWDRLRGSYFNYEQRYLAAVNKARQMYERAGVLKKRSAVERKALGKEGINEFAIDDAADEFAFNMSDIPQESELFREMAGGTTREMREAQQWFRDMMQEFMDLQGIVPKQGQPTITEYIHHVFDKSIFSRGRRPLEFIGMPRKAELFAAHLLDRGGALGYQRSMVAATEIYIRASLRKLILEPAFQDMIDTGAKLAKKHNNPNFQTYANDFVNELQGRPTLNGYKLDQWLGSPITQGGKINWHPGHIDRALMGVSTMIYSNLLGFNSRYGPMQIGSGILTSMSRFGVGRTMRGVMAQGTREGQAASKAAGVYKSYSDLFELRGTGGPAEWVQAWTDFVTKRGVTITPLGPMTNAGAEMFVRGVTFHTAVDHYLNKFNFQTMADATRAGWGKRILFEAIRSAEEINHLFGALGRSPWFSRTFNVSRGGMVSATQFLSFIPKQTEELLSQFARNPGRIGLYMGMSGFVSRIAAQQFGVDVTDYVGLGYLPQTPSDVTSPAVDLLLEGINFNEALDSHDPAKVAKTQQNLLRLLSTFFVPTLNAYMQSSKSAAKLESREERRPTGELVRPLPTIPEGPIRSVEDVTKALRPDVPPLGLGGETFPLVFRQPSIRERLTQRSRQALEKDKKRFYFNLRTALVDYANAVESDDEVKQAELLGELTNRYNVRLSSTNGIQRAIEARHIEERLRSIRRDRQTIDRTVEIIRDFGIGFGVEEFAPPEEPPQ
jgi:hypothetical protein